MKFLKLLSFLLPVVMTISFGGTAEASGALIFRLGAYSPDGTGAFWDTSLDTFDFNLGDFSYVMGGVELDLQIARHIELAVGLDGYSRLVSSSYRDFVTQNGADIARSFKLKVLLITGGLRLLPVGKHRRFIPHFAAGVGLYYFSYESYGDFVDISSQEIFPGSFSESGITPGAYAGAGLEFRVVEGIDPGQGWYAYGQFRRHWASPKLSDDLVATELNVGGTELSFGVSLRF